MVLQTERYNGGYLQQSYSGPPASYNNFQGVNDYTFQHSSPFQGSTYPSSHGPHPQSGWTSGGDYYNNGASHYPNDGVHVPVKLPTNGYGSSYYENPYTHGNSSNHGSPHSHDQGHNNSHGQGHGSFHGQGHESPHHQGYESPHSLSHGSPPKKGHDNPYGLGKKHGHTNQINKLTYGHNGYGTGSPNYEQNPGGFKHGYQQPSWFTKGLGDDDE